MNPDWLDPEAELINVITSIKDRLTGWKGYCIPEPLEAAPLLAVQVQALELLWQMRQARQDAWQVTVGPSTVTYAYPQPEG